MTSKRIVLCADGTGNTLLKNRGTNVFKLYEAVDVNGHKEPGELRERASTAPPRDWVEQIAIYDDGVGSQGNQVSKLFGGAFGRGLHGNVQQLYRALTRHYHAEADTEIYLFGFSRGAHTVRMLAHFISAHGIVDGHLQTESDLQRTIAMSYRDFQTHYRAGGIDHAIREGVEYRADAGDGAIHFLGMWDCVSAMFPRHRHLKIAPTVRAVAHALSIDDARKQFHPDLVEEYKPNGGTIPTDQGVDRTADGQVIEQVWFPGVHANVGGGYSKQGLSLIALDWMIDRAEDSGLRFVPERRATYRHLPNVHDKLHDSRSGMKFGYLYKPRDIEDLCAKAGVQPALHVSTFDRAIAATDGYAPGNLPPTYDIHATRGFAVELERVDEYLDAVDELVDANTQPLRLPPRVRNLLSRLGYNAPEPRAVRQLLDKPIARLWIRWQIICQAVSLAVLATWVAASLLITALAGLSALDVFTAPSSITKVYLSLSAGAFTYAIFFVFIAKWSGSILRQTFDRDWTRWRTSVRHRRFG